MTEYEETNEVNTVNPTGVYCHEHPYAVLIEDYRAGDQICSQCGLVVGDRTIDVGAEWRNFCTEKAAGVDNSRVGSAENTLLSDGGLSTLIGGGDGSASFDQNGTLTYPKGTLSRSDRTLSNAFREISEMGSKINLTGSIISRAHSLFKNLQDGKHLKGHSSDALSAACIYIACRQEKVPRTFKEICAISKISKKEIGKSFKYILKRMGSSVDMINTGDFMSRFCANLELPNSVERAATAIANEACELNLVQGKSPISVAAASIYMASQASEKKLSQKQIGDVAGVAEITIRQAYKLMYPNAEKLFPKNFHFFTPIQSLPPN